MITWPGSLVREIAARRCVLFLGAGVSAAARDAAGNHPKTWTEFLDAACTLVADNRAKRSAKKMIKDKNLLLALQLIKEHVNAQDYRNLLNQNFNKPFQPSTLHEEIYRLDSRLVITTNFDRIYEQYCLGAGQNAYKVITYYSHDLVDEIKSDTRLIIKAHGAIDDVSHMVFTKAEYRKAKYEHSHFYDILKAIFMTNTVVFIGCGLEDPDILLMLEDINVIGSVATPHYALVLNKSKPQYILKDWRHAYNVDAVYYGPNHADLVADIHHLADLVQAARVTTP